MPRLTIPGGPLHHCVENGTPLPTSVEPAAQGSTDVWPVSCNALDAPRLILGVTSTCVRQGRDGYEFDDLGALRRNNARQVRSPILAD